MLNNPLSPPGGQTPPAGDPPGLKPTPQGQTPSGRTPFDSLPLDVQDYIKTLRDEAKVTREQAKALQEQADAEAKAKADAAEAEAKAKGEFKQLAEKHEKRVAELEPIAQSYTKLAELVSEQIKDEIKDWPQSVKALDPGKDAPIEERLAWKNRAAAIVTELATTARGSLPGNRPNPTPQGQPSREELVAANRKELQKSRTYGI